MPQYLDQNGNPIGQTYLDANGNPAQDAAPNAGLAPPTNSIPPLGTLPKPSVNQPTGNDDFLAKTALRGLNTAGSMAQHPLNTLMNLPGPLQGAGNAIQSYQDFRAALKRRSLPAAMQAYPQTDEGVNRIAGQVGIDAPAVREAADSHDYGQLFAETAVPVGMALLGGKLGKKVSPEIPAPETQTAADNLVKVLNPSEKSAARTIRSVSDAMPALTDAARTSNPQTVQSLASAITNKQAELQGTFKQIKAPVANSPVDMTPIGQEMLKKITPGMKISDPQLVQSITNEANKYIGKTATIDDLDSLRDTLNSGLEGQYAKDGLTRGAAMKSPQYGYRFAEAGKARDLLYDSISRQTGQDLSGLKMLQSNLRNIQGKLNNVAAGATAKDMANRATPFAAKAADFGANLLDLHAGTAVRKGVGQYLGSARGNNAAIGRFTNALQQSQPRPTVPVIGSLAASMADDQNGQ